MKRSRSRPPSTGCTSTSRPRPRWRSIRPGRATSTQPYCTGKITYPADEHGNVRTGTLVVVKAGVPRTAPWSVHAYHDAHPSFPCDSTLDQLYTADRFDAYLALGHFAMNAAFDGSRAAYELRATPDASSRFRVICSI